MALSIQQKAKHRVLIALLAALLLPLFAGCGIAPLSGQTQNVKAQLDALLIHAAHFGVPQSSITSIKDQENTIITQAEWLAISETQTGFGVFPNFSLFLFSIPRKRGGAR